MKREVEIQTSFSASNFLGGFYSILSLLSRAHHDLLLRSPNATAALLGRGEVYEYFEEIRKKIALARSDLFFVDPYLDADFVKHYLPLAPGIANIRLLAREKLKTLLPAVEMFVAQYGNKVEVRSAANFHDRYLLINGDSCFQSGASFKDGAKIAPTTITQIMDAAAAVIRTYEDLWKTAAICR